VSRSGKVKRAAGIEVDVLGIRDEILIRHLGSTKSYTLIASPPRASRLAFKTLEMHANGNHWPVPCPHARHRVCRADSIFIFLDQPFPLMASSNYTFRSPMFWIIGAIEVMPESSPCGIPGMNRLFPFRSESIAQHPRQQSRTDDEY
jgi:hypothetical protein